MSKATQDSKNTETVTLDYPIKRDNEEIISVIVRKPLSGELRGLSLVDLLNMEVNALTKVLPRITQPSITEPEIRKLDPADLVQLGGAVSGFLVTKAAKEAFQPS